jgi:hypothetical protein
MNRVMKNATKKTIRTELINDLANEAATAATDMAADSFEDLLPDADAALAFITTQRYDTGQDQEMITLNRLEMTRFRHDYCRHLRNLGVPTDLAHERSFPAHQEHPTTTQTPTADQAYAARFAECMELAEMLRRLLTDHRDKIRTKDWGYVGDLGRAREHLCYALAALGDVTVLAKYGYESE